MKLLALSLAIFIGAIPAFSENKPYQEFSDLNRVFYKAQKRKLFWLTAVADTQFSRSLLQVSYRPPKNQSLPAREIIKRYEKAKTRGNLAGLASGLTSGIGTLMVIKRTLGLSASSGSGSLAAEMFLFLRNSTLRLFAVGVGVGVGLAVRHYVKKHYLEKYLPS